MTRLIQPFVLIAILLLAAESARAAERETTVIYTDAPLFKSGLHPHSFFEGDSFGCATRYGFGDWKAVVPPSEVGDEPFESWVRLDNYGVFHCAYRVGIANSQADLVLDRYGWIADLGPITADAKVRRLIVLQTEVPGGMENMFFLADLGPIGATRMDLLTIRCPKANWTEGGIDQWRQRVCRINDTQMLKRLARQAARRPSAAVFAYVGPAPDET